MPDCLSCLVKMVVGSFPIEDPHAQQRQQRSIVDFHPVDHTKPFSPLDHMSPQPIIKEQVREDVIPPVMVCSRLILPVLADPVEGGLGNLQISLQHFYKQKRRGKLPQASLDNVPIQTTGYTLRC